jgi:hypothetical protein
MRLAAELILRCLYRWRLVPVWQTLLLPSRPNYRQALALYSKG